MEVATQPSTQYAEAAAAGEDVAFILVFTQPADRSPVICKDTPSKSWTFGRSAACNHTLAGCQRLSNRHFVISKVEGDLHSLMIRDTSTNGTYLNNSRLVKNKGYLLVQGDEIAVGIGIEKDILRLMVSIPYTRRDPESKRSRAPDQGGGHLWNNDKYDLGSVLGRGAFASVCKGICRETGELCAIKIIAKRKISNDVVVRREINILKQLDHPHVAGLKDLYEDADSYYLVMEFIGGGDLMDFVIENGPIPEDASKEIVRQVLMAVAYVHGLGISHRDLKPDNILIAQDFPVVVKVADFGLAKISESGTFLKTFCGTLAYLAPEVMKARHSRTCDSSSTRTPVYNNLVDIWSVGCMAYVILSGYLPFDGATQEAMETAVMKGDYRREPLSQVALSASGLKFLKDLLQVDPTKRPTADEALKHPWLVEGLMHPEVPAPVSNAQETLDAPRWIQPLEMPNTSSLYREDSNDSEQDSLDVQEQAKLQCSQGAAVSSSGPGAVNPEGLIGVRDLDDGQSADNFSVAPPQVWMKLVTQPDSLPFKDIFVSKPKFFIGRNLKSDATVMDERMSKSHCQILRLSSTKAGKTHVQVWLSDMSANGCVVNHVRIGRARKYLLQDGDILHLFIDAASKRVSCVQLTERTTLSFKVQFLRDEVYERRELDIPVMAQETEFSSKSTAEDDRLPFNTKRAFNALHIKSHDTSRAKKLLTSHQPTLGKVHPTMDNPPRLGPLKSEQPYTSGSC